MKRKSSTYAAALTAATLFAGITVSCNKIETISCPGLEDSVIRFGAYDDTPLTKSAGSRESGASLVLRSPGSPDTLCLTSEITGGIETARKELTRAAVTEAEDLQSFRVLAYRNSALDGEGRTDDLFMNETATYDNGVFSTSTIYYWPGADHIFDFYAYSPYEGVNGSAPTLSGLRGLSVTVPAYSNEQHDIIVAKYENVSGDYNTTLPLDFKHICTQVKFRFGGQMQAGVIQQIRIKGAANSGTYDMSGGSWTLDGTTADFIQESNLTTTGSETGGDIGDSFMMLPQTLPDGAVIEIDFLFSGDTQPTTFSASIAGSSWPQGKTVSYSLSVSPNHEISITPPSEAQDAHYVICSAQIDVTRLTGGKQWTLSAKTSDDSAENISFLSELSEYHKNGYWTDRIVTPSGSSYTDLGSARGETTISGSGSQTVYIFLPENAGTDTRTVTLSLKVDDYEVATASFDQLCPDWNDSGFGWEQIENDPETTFGFSWNRTATYTVIDNWLYRLFNSVIASAVNDIITEHNAASYASTSSTSFLGRTVVSLDYSKLNNLSALDISSDNGQQNTIALYDFAGSGVGVEIEESIMNTGYFELTSENGNLNTDSGVLANVLRKNRYYLVRIEESGDGQTIVTETPAIRESDIVWYLPAVGQFSNAPSVNALTGTYWSSNPDSSSGSQNAYTSNNESRPRTESFKIRACRNKQ